MWLRGDSWLSCFASFYPNCNCISSGLPSNSSSPLKSRTQNATTRGVCWSREFFYVVNGCVNGWSSPLFRIACSYYFPGTSLSLSLRSIPTWRVIITQGEYQIMRRCRPFSAASRREARLVHPHVLDVFLLLLLSSAVRAAWVSAGRYCHGVCFEFVLLPTGRSSGSSSGRPCCGYPWCRLGTAQVPNTYSVAHVHGSLSLRSF